MDFLKKGFIVLLILILFLLIAVYLPVGSWGVNIYSFLGLEQPTKFSKLLITSIGGEIEIKIDGELKGSVGPEGSPLVIEDIIPGRRLLSITKINEFSNYNFEKLITFSNEIDTVVAYELGPVLEYSEGHIISANKNFAFPNSTFINVYTNPKDVKASLNSVEIGNTNLELFEIKTDEILKLTLEKEGYETIEINILPDDVELRNKLKGFEINIDAQLFLLPIEVKTLS